MMKINHRMEILFWKHSTKAQKRDGTCTLYLRVTVAGQREEIGSTGIRIHSDTWCERSQRVSYHDPNNHFKNEQLAMMESNLWAIYNELARRNQGITAQRIKRLYTRAENISYLAGFDLFQKEFNAQKAIKESTKEKLKTIKQTIQTFLIERGLNAILIEELDAGLLDTYKQWCFAQGHKESYILRNVRGLKRITGWALKRRLIDSDPLEHYQVGREKIKRPVYLSSQQLFAWSNHSFSSTRAQQAADLFVLYARTGFHYQDLMQVISNPDDHLAIGIDGKQWLLKHRQKTDVEAKVPISNFFEIGQIIEKYRGWDKLPTFTNATLNDYLKICVMEINIHLPKELRIFENLSVKHGRNSFCDYCFNELGLSKEAILTMIGRSSDSELKRYVRTDERTVISAFHRNTIAS